MIHIFTLKYGDRYPVDLVNNLFECMDRLDTRFYCYTDDPNGLSDGINYIPLNMNDTIRMHWYKMDFFKEDFVEYEEGDECLILDIDQVIVDDIDPLLYFEVDDGCLVTYKSWCVGCDINGGWYKFKANSMTHVYDKFYSDPEYYQLKYYNDGTIHKKYYGEQNFVCDEAGKIVTMPEELYSGKHPKSTVRIIHYNGLITQPLL